MVRARSAAAVESAGAGAGVGGGASTEAPRRSDRLLQARKRSHDASPPSPAQADRKRSRTRSLSKQDDKIVGRKIVGGGVDDSEAEIRGATLFHLTKEEMIAKQKRLYKKRANMGLAWYHENNPEGDRYEFLSMLLSDSCTFMDGCVCYLHMNFKARNVATRSQEHFFAEFALRNCVSDANHGYSTTACSIVDDNCVGGKKDRLWFVEDRPAERYDEKNCYACAEKIKHPTGSTYIGGHYVEDYFVGSSDSE